MKHTIKQYLALFCVVTIALASLPAEEEKGEWIQLFNGQDLTGWTPKFIGHELGENYKNTFRVEGGLLRVCYDQYEKWEGNFGHLFYKSEFSHYLLRAEYRFTGEQVKGGPDWAYRNNGFMIHGQTAESMGKDQNFPDSIEVQLLGGKPDGTGERSTLNLCTPGTHVFYKGKLQKGHVIKSNSKTYHGDQWVTVEVEVLGSEVIRHKIDGKVVLEYAKPQLNDGTLLEKGTIALQAESSPTDFRKIEVKIIKK